MSTIIIKMDSQKLIHPNLDMRYTIPDYIQEYTKGKITDNGYDLSAQRSCRCRALQVPAWFRQQTLLLVSV